MRQQGADAVATTEITLAVLREFPSWAIAETCVAIVHGKTTLDRRFAPNDSEIYDQVAKVVRRGRERLDTTRRLLAAKPQMPRSPAPGPRAPSGLPARITPWRAPPVPVIGERHQRLMADLAERKARNEARRQDKAAS